MRSTMLTAAILLSGVLVSGVDSASAFCHRYGFQAYGYYYPGSPCVYGWNNPCGCGIQAMVAYPSCGPGFGGRYLTTCYGVYKMHYHRGCPVLGAILHPFRHCRLARAYGYGACGCGPYAGYGCGGCGWDGCNFGDCLGGCGCGGCGYGGCGDGGCVGGGCVGGDCGYGNGGCVGGGCATDGAPVYNDGAPAYSDEGVQGEVIEPSPEHEALIYPRENNGSPMRLASYRRTGDGSQAFERGVEQYRDGLSQDALSAFQDAASAEPDNALYHYYQALALYEINGPEAANYSLQRAVSLEQKNRIENWGRRMERVQGQKRLWVEKARRQAGLGPK